MLPSTISEQVLKPWQHLLVLSAVIAAIISRRPDALLNPQFYFEDGAVWYANAWNLGWLHSLTLPEGGYLNTLPRLVCGLALLVPLKSAPLLLNWFGILIQALPVNLLLTVRCANWGPLGMRALQALAYVALPNSSELNVTITNAHWHLTLAACLIGFANPPLSRTWKVADCLLMLVVGLTGPWALILTPLLLVFWRLRHQSWTFYMAGLLASCAALQISELWLHMGEHRPTTPLGATPELFARLVAGQIYTGLIWGQNSFSLRASIPLIVLVFFAGTGVLIWGAFTLRLEVKLFIAASMLVLGAALYSPLIFGKEPRWQLLTIDKGARYWFFPMLALVWTLLWAAAKRKPKLLHLFSCICLVVMLRAVYHDWHYRAYQDAKFGFYAKLFDSAPGDTRVVIPIVPAGHEMVLMKR